MAMFIIPAICALVCGILAANKGRNIAGWVVGGFLIGIIGVIILLCLSNLKDEQNYRRNVEMKNRRLSEQLRQEQLKAESLRRHVMSRLDTHDNVLGVDTRQTAALPAYEALNQMANPSGVLPSGQNQYLDAGQSVSPQSPVSVGVPMSPAQWFYESGGRSFGPVSEQEIRLMLQKGGLRKNSLLWSERMADWLPANQIALFAKDCQG